MNLYDITVKTRDDIDYSPTFKPIDMEEKIKELL